MLTKIKSFLRLPNKWELFLLLLKFSPMLIVDLVREKEIQLIFKWNREGVSNNEDNI
jgi:hypothetical protein